MAETALAVEHQKEARCQRRAERGNRCRRKSKEQHRKKCKRQGIGHQRSHMAHPRKNEIRLRPAQLLAQQLRGARLAADMLHNNRIRYRNLIPSTPNGTAKLVIIGKHIREALETADLRERLAAKCNGRAKTWSRKAERNPETRIRKKMTIDVHGR